jgi:hypothetical protein
LEGTAGFQQNISIGSSSGICVILPSLGFVKVAAALSASCAGVVQGQQATQELFASGGADRVTRSSIILASSARDRNLGHDECLWTIIRIIVVMSTLPLSGEDIKTTPEARQKLAVKLPNRALPGVSRQTTLFIYGDEHCDRFVHITSDKLFHTVALLVLFVQKPESERVC